MEKWVVGREARAATAGGRGERAPRRGVANLQACRQTGVSPGRCVSRCADRGQECNRSRVLGEGSGDSRPYASARDRREPGSRDGRRSTQPPSTTPTALAIENPTDLPEAVN